MTKHICRYCVAEVQLFKQCRNLSAGNCAAGVQLFKPCRNLSAGTVLQGCSCLSGVETYLPALCCSCLSGVETYLPGLCCRGAAVKVVSKPICRHCVAEVLLFKQCRNLSAVTVLQWCSCLSGVETYLPAVCCRSAAFEAVQGKFKLHLSCQVFITRVLYR